MVSQPKHTSLLTILTQIFAHIRCIPVTKTLFLFCSILAVSLCTTNSFAQFTYELDKTTRFERMGSEEGLSTGFTLCIHQDKYGFIWIGTQYGLNLYDGYEVKAFHADPKNPQTIFNGFIPSIFEEPDGTMWFCTDKGISKYNRANQTFSTYLPDTVNLKSGNNSIQMIVNDGNQLWVDVYSKEFYRFNKNTEEFKSFAKDTLNPALGINGNSSDYIFIDGSGVLWVNSSEDGGDYALSKFNKESETFVHYVNDPSNPESFVGKEVKSMIEDHDGTIWLATFGGGLLELFDKENGKFRQYTYSADDPYSLLGNELLVVYEDSKGNIWTGGKDGFSQLNKNTAQFTNYKIPHYYNLSSLNGIRDINEGEAGELWLAAYQGFFRFDPSTKILRHYLNDPENKNSLSGNNIDQIMHDRSGQVWILTYNNGVNKLNHFSNSFRKAEMNSYDANSLSSNSISKIFGDSKGNLWIGTLGKGLNKTLLKKSRDFNDFEHYSIEAENSKSINGTLIISINEDKEQIIWIGTPQGLNRYNARNNDFTRFQHDPDDYTSISLGIVEFTFEDDYGILWVSTRNGLNIMDRETGKFLHFFPDKNNPGAIASNEVRVIYQDTYGELWFGGTYLEKLNRKDTSFIHYFADSIVFRDPDKKFIYNIAEDDSANLWMTTWWDGIIKFQRNDTSFVSITTNQGLPSNNVRAIEIDSKGTIWASTSKGLSRIDPKNYSIQNYDDADGLVNLELTNKSSFKDEDGWLYFGGRSGFTYFHPDSIKENKFSPPVYITSLTVSGQQKYFDKPLYEMSAIELLYNENDFSFDFVALNYINSQKNQYAYMLEGYDEDWKHIGNRRTAYFTHLSPGEYTFRVKGSNNDGYWNEEGASLVVVIHPPMWKTWWAYTLYLFFAISLLYIIFQFYLRRQRLLHQLDLEQVQSEKLTELDIEKNKFFSNISHEFRTPLTLILGPLERLIGSPKDEDQKQELSLVRRNARRLQTLINQLLSLSKLESGKMKLKARPENIVKLTRLFLQSFHSMAEDKGIKLEFESNVEESIVYIDTLKFEKVANNLLSNAFKFTEKGGSIKVNIKSLQSSVSSLQSSDSTLPTADCRLLTPGCIQIKFSDTGIGIQKEDLPHIFDRFYQVDENQMKTNLGTGIGLALTKELIELHHGTITAESEPGKGTTFTIMLPIGNEHLLEDEIIVASNFGSETDDELLNDDYLFVQEVATKTELKTEVQYNSKLPLLLIVEDNDDMRAYIKSYLTGLYNIIEAENGKEGAEKAIEQIPDLIVSDLMMPKLDGNEMTTQLKSDERTSHIPVILLTAKASRESKMEGLETGADDFLTKPFDADELLIRINNLINQRKRLREVFGKKLSYTVSPNLGELVDSGITTMDEQFMKKAFEITEKEMSDPEFDVSSFSKEMGLSRMQLHRKLKALTDESTTEFIKIIRLNKAAVLLKSKSATVTEIAYDIGFSSPSYFSACFKVHFGKTPLEYTKE